jgi:uncharacterized protein (DUF433 family)
MLPEVNKMVMTQVVPITTDQDGVMRISGTRVPIDTIVDAFKVGATAEEIAQQYPAVALADVYAVISYYLHNMPEIETYLSQRQAFAERVRQENESRYDPIGIRERLLARVSTNKTR